MSKFALIKNEFAVGSINVYNLIVDDIDQFETFEESVENIDYSQFTSFAATISQISENKKPPPRGKRRKIEGMGNAGEMRTKNLRLYYLVVEKHGYTICLGGYKKTQKKDIKRLKQLQREILNQINEHGKIEIKEKTKINKGYSSSKT